MGVCIQAGVGHSGTVNACAISPDQTFIVSVGSEGGIFIWKIPKEIQDKCHDITVGTDVVETEAFNISNNAAQNDGAVAA